MSHTEIVRPLKVNRQTVINWRVRGLAQNQALVLAENLPPIIARQPALYEDKHLWRHVEAEVAAVRAENTAARSRIGAPPAGMAL